MLRKSTKIHLRGAGVAPASSSPILVVYLCLIYFAQPARAGIVWSGDIVPADPTAWTSNTYAYIGDTSSGSVTVDGDSDLLSYWSLIGYESGATGEVTVDGIGSTWTNSDSLYVGSDGSGTLNITGGGSVRNGFGIIGYSSNSTGEVTVDGVGSTWTNSDGLGVGGEGTGSGTLIITGGGAVSSGEGVIGYSSNSTGVVTVDGDGLTWTNSDELVVGAEGTGTLYIAGDGLVSVAGTLYIDDDGDGDGFINLATGGMLALYGDADGSLNDFLGLIDGTDAIRYWDDSISNWADITGATYGDDYALDYQAEGDLAGYTLLTVYTTEPGADFNGDWHVDGDDLLIWKTYFGLVDPFGRPVQEIGDADEDSDIDGNDFLIWQTQFTGGLAASASSANVPEPSSIMLLLAAFACGLRCSEGKSDMGRPIATR